MKEKQSKIDADYVRNKLTDIVKDQDLSRYILLGKRTVRRGKADPSSG